MKILSRQVKLDYIASSSEATQNVSAHQLLRTTNTSEY